MKKIISSTVLMCMFALSAKGQSSLAEKDSLLYTCVTLFAERRVLVESMIDTGCSICVIDSAFAKDSLGLKLQGGRKVPVNTKNDSLQMCVIDSMNFCGKPYHKIPCLVADLKGHFMRYAPNFIVGADILKDRPLKFNRESMMIEPSDEKHEENGIILKWEKNKNKQDIPIMFVIFETKIQGKKYRFAFDTGKKGNKLPVGIPLKPSGTVQRESADAFHRLEIRQQKIYNNVDFQIGNQSFNLDFIEGKTEYGLLGLDLTEGHSFILNYKNRTLEILSQ